MKRLLPALLAFCMLLTGCAAQQQPAPPADGDDEQVLNDTQSQPPPAEGKEEDEVDPYTALFPADGNVLTKKEFVKATDALAENVRGRINEVTYTWIKGKTSMEILNGVRDDFPDYEPPEENPLELVYGESELYNYVLYLPEGYDSSDTETKWPVIYFFHGIGESGSDLSVLLPYGVLKYLTSGGKLDAIVIAPQCPGDSHWADTDVEVERLKQFVPEMCGKYQIDTDRMYLTGLSMGGRCTWKLALAMPETFAAIAPVCGRTNTYEFETIKNMPIWMFHAAQDGTVSFDNINKILPVLAEKDHRYYKLTVYPYLGHDIWSTTYQRADLYEWLLSQSLSRNLAEAE